MYHDKDKSCMPILSTVFSMQKEIYMYRQSSGSHLEILNERYAINPFLLSYYDHNVSFEGSGLTLKLRLKSNQLFPTSQKCFYASLVKIHALARKIEYEMKLHGQGRGRRCGRGHGRPWDSPQGTDLRLGGRIIMPAEAENI